MINRLFCQRYQTYKRWNLQPDINLWLTLETRYSTASDVSVRAMEDIIEDILTIAEDGLLGVDDLAAWRRSGKKA